jgi:hypothetical protein
MSSSYRLRASRSAFLMSAACVVSSPPASKVDDRPAFPEEVHAVARAVADAQLRHALANRLHIAGVAGSEPLDAGLDPSAPTHVPQVVEPRGELG